MTKELIISAYQRDYEWVNKINSNVRITVYNKNISEIKSGETSLINVGQCVHTFFWHLYKHYDSLADFTFTAQDYPFDHVSNYIDIINGDVELWNQQTGMKVGDCWFFNTASGQLTCDSFGRPHNAHALPLERYWVEFFEDPFPGNLTFLPAGHFCISKEQVHKIPKHLLKKVLTFLEEEKDPWAIERLEPYILGANLTVRS